MLQLSALLTIRLRVLGAASNLSQKNNLSFSGGFGGRPDNTAGADGCLEVTAVTSCVIFN